MPGRQIQLSYAPPVDWRQSLPGAPLARAVRRQAQRDALGYTPAGGWDTDHAHGVMSIYERIGTPARRVFGWADGFGVTWPKADEVLTRMGLLWWDVWNEDTVRLPVIVARVYGRHRHQGRAARRVLYRTVPYGDQGPDRAALERVRAIMEGNIERVAA